MPDNPSREHSRPKIKWSIGIEAAVVIVGFLFWIFPSADRSVHISVLLGLLVIGIAALFGMFDGCTSIRRKALLFPLAALMTIGTARLVNMRLRQDILPILSKETGVVMRSAPLPPPPRPQSQPNSRATGSKTLDVRFGFPNGIHWQNDGPGNVYLQFIMNILNLSRTDPIVLDFQMYFKFSGVVSIAGKPAEMYGTRPWVHLLPEAGTPKPNPLNDRGLRIEPLADRDIVFEAFVPDGVDTATLSDHEMLLVVDDRISKRRAANPITPWSNTKFLEGIITPR